MAVLTIRKLCKTFSGVDVLDRLDLRVDAGQLLVLLGKSGAGKSTLLRLIAGLDTPDSGQIEIDGQDLTRLSPQQRNVSMVFQDFALYPHMTVRGNIAFPLKGRRISRADCDARVTRVAHQLGLGDLLLRYPDQLSGGQQQRLAVARALVRDSQLLLMDEPLSNIDAPFRHQLRNELRRLQKEFSLTIVYVTHDQADAMLLADQIAVIDRGQVQQVGTPAAIYDLPVNRTVASLVGWPPMNFLPAGQGGTWGIRPEDIRLHKTGNSTATEPKIDEGNWSIAGTIAEIQCGGACSIISVQSSLGPLTAMLSRQHQLQTGQSVIASADGDRVHRFTADGASMRVASVSASPTS